METTKQMPLGKKILSVCGKVGLFLITFLLIVAIMLFATMKIICNSSIPARNTFITTVLETGQLKFLASLCLSEEEIKEVVAANSMKAMDDDEIDENLIVINAKGADHGPEQQGEVIGGHKTEEKPIEIDYIKGLTYNATMMIVKDPSRLSIATNQNPDGSWPTYGITLEKFVQQNHALGGINAGLYSSTNNTGGYPFGVVVSHGKIVRNLPQEWSGLVMIGLTEEGILQIIDVSHMTPAQAQATVTERKIRDACCFQEEMSSDNNHFVQLVINGTPRKVNGAGSGLNPRTAIGQREDGALLLLVTDGRGYNGHAGASAADLIDLMVKYGAVNAANLDGGSSTCMYYDGEYLQNSVTFYYSQSSWKLPFAFLID